MPARCLGYTEQPLTSGRGSSRPDTASPQTSNRGWPCPAAGKTATRAQMVSHQNRPPAERCAVNVSLIKQLVVCPGHRACVWQPLAERVSSLRARLFHMRHSCILLVTAVYPTHDVDSATRDVTSHRPMTPPDDKPSGYFWYRCHGPGSCWSGSITVTA